MLKICENRQEKRLTKSGKCSTIETVKTSSVGYGKHRELIQGWKIGVSPDCETALRTVHLKKSKAVAGGTPVAIKVEPRRISASLNSTEFRGVLFFDKEISG